MPRMENYFEQAALPDTAPYSSTDTLTDPGDSSPTPMGLGVGNLGSATAPILGENYFSFKGGGDY